jgi:hypothetical protein
VSKSHCYIVGAPNQASSSAPDFDSFGNHPNINHGSLVNSPRARWPFRRRHLIGLRPWLTWKALVNASPKNRFCALLHSTTIRCDASVPTGPASIRKFCSRAIAAHAAPRVRRTDFYRASHRKNRSFVWWSIGITGETSPQSKPIRSRSPFG